MILLKNAPKKRTLSQHFLWRGFVFWLHQKASRFKAWKSFGDLAFRRDVSTT